jgi:hypothetical protein
MMGNYSFNHMMQNLTSSFPTLNYLMNQATRCPPLPPPKKCTGWITPLQNDTWQLQTYIAATVKPGTYNVVSGNTISALNKIYPGKVVVHFDADAKNSNAPMGIFANQSSPVEISTITNLTNTGLTANASLAYSLLYPILGAASHNSSLGTGVNYNGTLYNGLTIGKFARSTAHQIIRIMNGT